VQSQIATIQNSLATKESQFERGLSEVKQHHDSQLAGAKADLSDSIGKIQDLLNRTRGDWMVADAEYLLSVANQRLNLVGDVKTSLIALQAADERLRDSGNPGVFKIREEIAREINKLKDLKPVDIVGVFARIRILEDQVKSLPVFLPHAEAVQEKVKSDEPASETKDISGVDDFLDSAIEDLKGLVEVRRSDREIVAVLHPEEVRIIREELKIKLELVRLALLERDAELYRLNIDEVKDWIQDHFRTEAPETKKFVAELNDLRTVGLDIDYPDISGSLKLLQNLASLRLETEKSGLAKPPAPQKPAATESKGQQVPGEKP
jgi:uncharacterized protein HemX